VRPPERRLVRLAATAAVFLALSVPAHAEPSVVDLGGAPAPLGTDSWTLRDLLAAVNRVPRPGAMRAAVSGRVLVHDADAPHLTVNGLPASFSTRLRPHDKVQASDGVDSVESVEERVLTGPVPGLPALETTLWRPGRQRVERRVVGRTSGEVVSAWVVPEQVAVPETGKVVALTFDDGPDPRWTPEVLQILHDEGVRATFCVLASSGRRNRTLVRAETDAGHTHCDHTIDHPHLPRLSHDDLVAQVKGGADFLASVDDGVPPALFRAPYGELSPDVFDMVHAANLRVLGWSVDPSEFAKPPAETIVTRVVSAVRPGGVVLLHDGGGDRSATVAALRPIIRALKDQGYTFSTPTTEPPVDAVPPEPGPAGAPQAAVPG
jgi:peptidoglycan/xylan/chitin deacetylase (PgdA/CDA1 family)